MGHFYGTEIHLGLFLSVWLLGIAAGGYLGGKFNFSAKFILRAMFAAPLLSLFVIYQAPTFLPEPGGGFLSFVPVSIFIAICVIPLSLIIGTLLPSLIRITGRSLGIFYGYEAIGGFMGGLFFSLLLGGTADPVLSLLSVPIAALTASIVCFPDFLKLKGVALLALPLLLWHFGPEFSHATEHKYWQLFHSPLKLEKTVETPYQKLQLATYYDQHNLFSNGMFSDSWPVTEDAEQKVHSFMTALSKLDQILIIGAPTKDIIEEFLKYPEAGITIVEIDADMVEMLNYPPEYNNRVNVVFEDPRAFLNNTTQKFDGIIINPVSPVTLVGNRLFTIEAFRAISERLSDEGVMSLQVSGTENYMGSIKEQIILSAWTGLGKIFPHLYAFPGSTITFFASHNENAIPKEVQNWVNRFAHRQVNTSTFFPMSFYNLLMPFRVEELNNWLKKEIPISLNTDSHPETFVQQIELWNIYSGEKLSHYLSFFNSENRHGIALILVAATVLFLALLQLIKTSAATTMIIVGGVGISGATGLLSEIILILLYQNSHGAAYQMSALFFGIYMLGLASGAWLFGKINQHTDAFVRLKKIKLAQIAFTASAIFWVDMTWVHSALVIAIGIFTIAFIDGIELPIADALLRKSGHKNESSAGLLVFADNTGALAAGTLSGLWLLPAIGMKNSFALLAVALGLNLVTLLLFGGKFAALRRD